MKIDIRSAQRYASVDNIRVGEVFEYKGEHYMRVNEGHINGDLGAVNLRTGGRTIFTPGQYDVTPVRAKIVLDD